VDHRAVPGKNVPAALKDSRGWYYLPAKGKRTFISDERSLGAECVGAALSHGACGNIVQIQYLLGENHFLVCSSAIWGICKVQWMVKTASTHQGDV